MKLHYLDVVIFVLVLLGVVTVTILEHSSESNSSHRSKNSGKTQDTVTTRNPFSRRPTSRAHRCMGYKDKELGCNAAPHGQARQDWKHNAKIITIAIVIACILMATCEHLCWFNSLGQFTLDLCIMFTSLLVMSNFLGNSEGVSCFPPAHFEPKQSDYVNRYCKEAWKVGKVYDPFGKWK